MSGGMWSKTKLKENVMKTEFVRKCTAEENEELNKYAEMDEPQEWVILKQKK